MARSKTFQPALEPLDHGNCELENSSSSQAPDIYYIILDAYAREDDLLDAYQFDNSEFLRELEGLGFYVADWSQSNYSSTLFSVTSSLNMDYLQSLDRRIEDGALYDTALIWPLLADNVVRRNLECIGYKVVSFDSGWHALGWRDADVYLGPEVTSFAEGLELSQGINEFESMLLQSSAALVLTDAASIMPKFLSIDTGDPFRNHRLRMLYEFDALADIVPKIEGPKFVLAHIMATHTPYMFGPNGEEVEHEGVFTLVDLIAGELDEPAKSAYRDQVKYVNSRVKDLIRNILDESKVPPVIIIQSDHGAERSEGGRLNILNAYLLPDEGDLNLYDTISPVNSFRIVFNSYLSGEFDLLRDISYSSPYESFEFTIDPNEHASN